MISFYPGPSQVYYDIPKYVKDAHAKGILSMNHRSTEFMDLYKETVTLLKAKLNIPDSYKIFFTSSSTECWEIIAQSIIDKDSLHIFNGAFGEKWFTYTQRLTPAAQPLPFDCESKLPIKKIPDSYSGVLCITQNETSNGTEVNAGMLQSIKRKYSKALIAVDATSSMGGIALNFKSADIWFASVQKCFGLPAGLAVLVCAPKAIQRMKSTNESGHYNSLSILNEMADKWQTSYTPNVLGIYLLMRTLKKRKSIEQTHQKIKSRSEGWQKFFRGSPHITFFIKNQTVTSLTVLTLTAKPELIKVIKHLAITKGILLGDGYGSLKQDTFRIANFPAIKDTEIRKLQQFLRSYL
ncbi:MAG: alanine--glyoxylate aminotransferase family protein [Cyclobacteriaceae bacterium]|nr:alanine--glyoxylate aminotransferase family protein [Cyclobacteriaceae bacterium]